jgi:hypothetical protein
MINIISTFYLSKYNSHLDNLRSQELIDSLLKNLESSLVEKIHLFIDDNESLDKLNNITNHSDKIIIIEIGKKPKYSDFFRYIIDNLQDQICMITNADIYLHECNVELINLLNKNKIVYALTRYEYDMSKPLIDNYLGSHDAYIFHSSFIEKNIMNEDTDFYQNFPGIETHIIKSFFDCGFQILNPCKEIKIVHLHKTNLRNHGEWIGLHNYGDEDFFKKSCWYVPPTTINKT